MPGEDCEGCVDFAFSTGVQHGELQTESARRSLHIAGLAHPQWKFRIDQRCKRAGIGHKVTGKFYPLWSHLHSDDAHSGDVAARPVELSDKSGLTCIPTEATNYWYCRGRCLGCQSRRFAADGSDHRNLARHQFRSKRWQSIILAFRPAILDCDILAFKIASLTKSLAK